MTRDDATPRRAGLMRVTRSRGLLSGVLLMLLGAWGALIPFIGPYFHYAYTPDSAWTWTSGRLWMEVLPGAAAFVGGLLLATTANRAVGVFAGWLASLAGAWFIVGPVLARAWDGPTGSVGSPVGGTARGVWEQIGFFSGLGAVILFLAAQALGRFTVRSVRDVRAAETYAARTTVPADRTDRDRTAVQPAVQPTAEPGRHAEFADNRGVQPQETGAGHEPPRTDTVAMSQPTAHSGESATRVDTRRDG
jgi:hypothetical protein